MTPANDMSLRAVDLKAAEWFARQRAGDLTPDEAADLQGWLDERPEHLASFERLERAWSGAEVARTDPRILMLRERALKRPRQPRILAMRAIAASFAAAMVIAGFLVAAPFLGLSGYGSLTNQTFRTAVGQQATVTLSDGSVVTLNTDTRLRTRAAKGKRLIYLDRGQAYFRVAKDPLHPFIVNAAGRTVTAVGTAFDVRLDAGEFEVVVVEGKVRVEQAKPSMLAGPRPPAPPKPAELTAGAQLVAAREESAWTVAKANPADEVSWLRGYVVFQRARFADVAAEMNRYSERKLIVDDPTLAEAPVSGAFKAGDLDAFVQAFEEYGVVRVESEDANAVRLAAFEK